MLLLGVRGGGGGSGGDSSDDSGGGDGDPDSTEGGHRTLPNITLYKQIIYCVD